MSTTVIKLPVSTLRGYSGNMALLNRKGRLAYIMQACKETNGYLFMQEVVMDGQVNIAGYQMERGCNRKRPRFVMYTPDGKKDTIEFSAERVLAMLNLLHKTLNLPRKPRVAISTKQNENGIIFTVDPWLYRFPVNHHAMHTFVRIAIQKHGIRIDEIGKIIDTMVSDLHDDKDGHQLRTARNSGALDGFLNKSLKCYDAPGYESWFWKVNETGTMPNFIGIASYGHATWSGKKFTPSELVALHGTIHAKQVLQENPKAFDKLTDIVA
jgi:hypothetical protein